ncbi:hypothetical protein L1887_23846 [Cichorium endivia]|nr:hypothetical protein L1887_23846 [Cichorium endivia]
METRKEVEDLSRIQKRLVRIENQQSNLLNLLQKFMGNSRSGMNYLETPFRAPHQLVFDITKLGSRKSGKKL